MAGGREQRKKMLKDHTVTDWHAGFIGRFGTGGDEVCCCFNTFTERNAGEQLCGDDGCENVTGSRPGTSAYRNTAAVRCAMFGIKRKIDKKSPSRMPVITILEGPSAHRRSPRA